MSNVLMPAVSPVYVVLIWDIVFARWACIVRTLSKDRAATLVACLEGPVAAPVILIEVACDLDDVEAVEAAAAAVPRLSEREQLQIFDLHGALAFGVHVHAGNPQ